MVLKPSKGLGIDDEDKGDDDDDDDDDDELTRTRWFTCHNQAPHSLPSIRPAHAIRQQATTHDRAMIGRRKPGANPNIAYLVTQYTPCLKSFLSIYYFLLLLISVHSANLGDL
ncbi:hypothetical protein ElyMa_005998200 [Elysia marginata]|uniref:Uncharacterized protein n=1 Tax=Elysia marginata TaxID=1093978 RepID=A0AAV4GFB0_9GAST|nr:hypothetical protein ElyMa_005998200 [Elysia marginata]